MEDQHGCCPFCRTHDDLSIHLLGDTSLIFLFIVDTHQKQIIKIVPFHGEDGGGIDKATASHGTENKLCGKQFGEI